MAQVNMEMGKATTFVRAFSTSAYKGIETVDRIATQLQDGITI